jgi:two-component system sensor histidine kinase MprB
VTAWIRRKSFRVRLGALVAAAVGVAVALAALASYFAVHHQLYRQVDSSLQSEMAAAPRLSRGGQFETTLVAGFLGHFDSSVLQVVGPSGIEYSSTAPNPPLPVSQADADLAQASTQTDSFRTLTSRGTRYRVITEGGDITDQDGNSVAIQIARPLTDIDHSLADLRLILWIVGLSGVVVAVGLGYLVGKATIRPVERLTAAAEHVAATQDLESTIDDRGEDELARLARSFNSMLRALAASRQQQAQLISDAGHELRTPLTSLRTNIEVLLRVKDLPEVDRADLLADVHAQLEEMTTLVGDVVELAREDEGQTEPIEVRLDAIVGHAVERARRRAPDVAFDVELTAGSVRAQPALLERAVLNVLDNAAKWSPRGGTVRVWLQRGQWWTLDVLDQGPGIAAADLPHVFERFYRAEAARALPGSGLGLAIVQRVVTGHGGSVNATSPPGGGTLVHIELPTVTEHEPEPEPEPVAMPEPTPESGPEPKGTAVSPWAQLPNGSTAEDEAQPVGVKGGPGNTGPR